MRITGGIYRGRTIYSPKGNLIRPATDRTRESIFAIIPQFVDLDGATIYDLFAGTGSLGFECISRGAEYVVFVDSSFMSVNLIKKTAMRLNCDERCKVIHDRVERFIKKAEHPADLVFIDPPYRYNDTGALPETITQSKLLNKNGIFVIEHERKTEFPHSRNFTIIRYKIFGNTAVTFFKSLSNS